MPPQRTNRRRRRRNIRVKIAGRVTVTTDYSNTVAYTVEAACSFRQKSRWAMQVCSGCLKGQDCCSPILFLGCSQHTISVS